MRRRELLKSTGVAAAMPAVMVLGSQDAAGSPNNRIGGGVIRLRGSKRFMVHQMRRSSQSATSISQTWSGARALAARRATYNDYRQLLEDKNVQAVIIATPEHWNALMCVDACEAGKDVYVEKPASHNIRDGRLMLDPARRSNCIVQVGSQQRSGAHFKRAVKYVQKAGSATCILRRAGTIPVRAIGTARS